MGIDCPRILAVDDNPDNLIALRAVVSDAFPGALVLEAVTGLGGIGLAVSENPDLVLLDIIMPGLDGFEVCRRLKAGRRTRHIPVVFLTSLKTESDLRTKALEAGAEGFLTKPIDRVELIAQIKAMVKIKAANDRRIREKADLAAMVEERTRDLEMEVMERLRSQDTLRTVEDRYRAIFENMAAACCVDEVVYEDGKAKDYRILDVNPSYERISGLSRGSVVGKLATEAYAQKEPSFLDVFAEVAETGRSASFEAFFEPIGKYIQMTVGCPGRGMFSTVFTDISERKEVEEKLKASESGLRQAQKVAHVGSWVWHIQANSVDWSDEMFRIFGIAKGEFSGHLPDVIARAVHPDDRAKVDASNRAVSEKGRPEPVEYRIVHADGSIHTVWGEAGELTRDAEGKPFTLTGIVQDVTERKEAERKILQLNMELEQRVRERTEQLVAANRELEAFAYSVSHDLRAPLRALDGFSAALLVRCKDILNEEGAHYLDQIQTATKRMGKLIEDLLDLSRITRQEMIREKVDIEAIARKIARECAESEPERKASFRIAPGLVARGDPRLMAIAMGNLIGNAWKFTSRKDEAKIEIGSESVRGEKTFYVRDNGAGFDMAYADKLFTPFQRLHGVSEFPGTGIGLATVNRIISRHGGRIWVDAEPDKGAVFHFTLGGAT